MQCTSKPVTTSVTWVIFTCAGVSPSLLTQCRVSVPRWRPGCFHCVLWPSCTSRGHQLSCRLQSAPRWSPQNLPESLTSTTARWQITQMLFTATRWQPLRGKPALDADLKLNCCLLTALQQTTHSALLYRIHKPANDIKSMWEGCALQSIRAQRSQKICLEEES